jgi:hypothetical protein
MKLVSYFFFYTYIGVCILAGFWGAFLDPRLDFQLLFNLDTASLPDYARVNMLSQFRFLRAIEFGFGMVSLLAAGKIFSEKSFNLFFLLVMASGIVARSVSIILDGMPSPVMLSFLIFELVGLAAIFIYSKTQIYANA